MCGILGIASIQKLKNYNEFDNALRIINHRGPDSSNKWLSKNEKVLLGHNRLSIIDLSKSGIQPMHFDNNLTIVYNGEIYNFRELKNELIELGYKFTSRTDTEVILLSYKQWGKGCLEKFNGMFSFVIYDSLKNIVFIARDRAGEKPLYYSIVNSKIYFSSELKSLIKLNIVKHQIDTESFINFLTYGFVKNKKSILKNFFKLPPAHYLTFNLDNGEKKLKRYWKPSIINPIQKKSYNMFDLIKEFEDIFNSSVERQLFCDVSVGILLSGGIDSSLVTAFAASKSEKVKTFNVKFVNEEEYDESKFAKKISSYFNTDHHELAIYNIEPSILSEIVNYYDEPIIDSSVIPTYLICREVKKYCKVVLGGDGGDELFGGYKHYKSVLLLNQIHKFFPTILNNFISKTADNLLPIGFKARHWIKLLSINPSKNLPIVPIHFDLQLRKELLKSYQNYEKYKIDNTFEYHNNDLDIIKHYTLNDFNNYLPEDLLVKIDRASMANSIEMRSPFLDYRIIKFCFEKLQSSYKVNIFNKKIFLKKIARKYFPNDYDYDRKQGFTLPLNKWLQKGPWKDYFYDVLSSENNVFNKKLSLKLLENQNKGYLNSERLFGLVFFILWMKKYEINFN